MSGNSFLQMKGKKQYGLIMRGKKESKKRGAVGKRKPMAKPLDIFAMDPAEEEMDGRTMVNHSIRAQAEQRKNTRKVRPRRGYICVRACGHGVSYLSPRFSRRSDRKSVV